MYCNNCGKYIRDGAVFCPSCGHMILSRTEVSSPENVKEKALEKLQEYDVHEKVELSKKNVANAFDWYTYNWSRLFKTRWRGIELKHHAIWGGVHAVVLLIILLIILNPFKGATTVTKEKIEVEDTEEITDLNYAAKVLFSSLNGTWTNDAGTFTLTIGEDGTVRIADSSATFGADAFTYTEVDDNTIRLKVASDDALAGMLSIDMDYEVNGEILTVTAMNQSFELKRKK